MLEAAGGVQCPWIKLNYLRYPVLFTKPPKLNFSHYLCKRTRAAKIPPSVHLDTSKSNGLDTEGCLHDTDLLRKWISLTKGNLNEIKNQKIDSQFIQ